MGRTAGSTEVSVPEFKQIKADLKSGKLPQGQIALKYKRSQSIISRIKSAATYADFHKKKPAKAKKHLLDSNLTKKQAKAFLDMQTDLNFANREREAQAAKIERLQGLVDFYRKREMTEFTKKAKQSRSIWRFVPRFGGTK